MTPPDHVGDDPVPHAGGGSQGLSTARLTGLLNGTYAQLGFGSTGLVNPAGLRRWRAALAEAMFAPAPIVALGHSIMVGVGSDGSASSAGSDATYRAQGWVGQLRSLFTPTYGDPGEGFIGSAIADNGNRWTYSGGAAVYGGSGPIHSGAKANTNTQTITVATPACTQIDFWTWDGGGDGSATASYNVDGAGAVTFNAGNGFSNTAGWTKRSITSLANTTHSVVFTGPSTGNGLYVVGVEALKQTTGVRVHRIARAGNTSNNLLGQDLTTNGNAGAQARVLGSLGVVPAAKLVIIETSVNDFSGQNNGAWTLDQPGSSPSVYAANLQAAVNQIVGAGGCVLILNDPRQTAANYPNPMTYTEQQYADAAKSIAAATDHCAFLDIGSAWGGTRAPADNLGVTINGTIHPARAGHGDMARLIHRALTLPNLG